MNFNNIIIFLLGILSIRDLISKNFDIPKNKRWSWLFYNSKEKSDVPYCYQLNKINKNKTPISYKDELLPQLILILGNHTKYFEQGAFCDRDKLKKIRYLVSTVEAAHTEKDLIIMLDMLEKMYYEICSSRNVDFVISLKGGNVILVNKLVDSHKNDILHLTYNRNLFYESYGVSYSNKHDLLEGADLQFENLHELIRLSKLSNRNLNGIILDCSFSSGKGIVECVKDFNKIIEDFGKNEVKINPITEVRTLYSHIGEDIQKELQRYNCNINYFFSLDENVRKMLYDLIHQENDQSKKLENAHAILEYMKKNNMLQKTLLTH